MLKKQPVEKYKVNDMNNIISISAENTVTEILVGAAAYVIHIILTDLENKSNTVNLYSVKMDFLSDLPDFIKSYKNIFSAEAAATANPPPDAVHNIETEQGSAPLFLLIYSLLVKELDMLKEYLNNALEKG